MHTAEVLQWDLHGRDSHITFRAKREDDRYDMVIRGNDAVLLADVAPDVTALLRKSQALRTQLLQLGYSPKP